MFHLTASWWIMNNNWRSKAAALQHNKSRRKSRLYHRFIFFVLWYPLFPHGMTRIVFCKALLRGYKKEDCLDKSVYKVKQIKPLEEKKKLGNAIVYCVIGICAKIHVQYWLISCFWFNRRKKKDLHDLLFLCASLFQSKLHPRIDIMSVMPQK